MFKIGDKVRRKEDCHFGMTVNDIGTITKIQTGVSADGIELKEYKGVHSLVIGKFELVEQTYTKLTPEVGDKFRVVKSPPGTCFDVDEIIEYGGRHCAEWKSDSENYIQIWGKKHQYTTEYLEPVEEEQEHMFTIKRNSGGIGGDPNHWHTTATYLDPRDTGAGEENVEVLEHHGTPYRANGMMYGNILYYNPKNNLVPVPVDIRTYRKGKSPIEQELNKTKQTTMQKLTSALKRVLSADKQTLYKARIIGQDLTLTAEGKTHYVDALFENEGDHKKAMVQLVEVAQEEIDAINN